MAPPPRPRTPAAARLRWGAAFAVVVALHLAALYWPRVTIEGPVSWTDKLVHPVLFFGPVLVGSIWWGRWQPVAAVFAVHAVLSEVLQHAVLPHRTGDPWDAVADLLGIAVALAVVVPRQRRRSAPGATGVGQGSSGASVAR